jgi:hypothetical protein
MNIALKNKFLTEINSRIKDATETIVTGSLEPKDYGIQCGRVCGMDEAIRVLEEIWEDYCKNMSKLDEDFE